MSFSSFCPNCRLSFVASEEEIGQQYTCSRCGEVYRVEHPYAAPRSIDDDLPTAGIIHFSDGVANGFNLFAANFGVFLLLGLVFSAVQLGLAAVQQLPIFGIFAALANNLFLSPVMTAGFYRSCLRQHDGGTAQVDDLFSEIPMWVDLLLLVLVMVAITLAVMGIPVVITLVGAGSVIFELEKGNETVEPWQIGLFVAGLLTLVALGIGIGMAFAWTYLAVVDRRSGFWDAITTSFNLTKGNPLATLGIILLGGMLMGAGLLLCGIGVILSFPLQFCLFTAAYRTAVPPPAADGLASGQGRLPEGTSPL